MNNSTQYLGEIVKVKIDRPLGSKHPKHNFIYEVNYGYIPDTISGDGEELDAYILGIDVPLTEFEGKCIAVIKRTNDNDDKLIIVPKEIILSNDEIERLTFFQEKWFKHNLISLYPTIYLLCGFMGFGKTTLAKKLEQELSAARFTPDEIMLKRYGRTPDNFQQKYQEVDDFIRQKTAEQTRRGKSVILDYGFWSKACRKEYYEWAKTLTPNVYLYTLICDMETAKKRVLQRTLNNPDELFIDEGCFNNRLRRYEPLTEDEGYPVIFYKSKSDNA